MDGKTLRGAIRPDGSRVHLISAMRTDGVVLAQREAAAKSNEITAFRPLLEPLDPAGCVVTFDALLTQTDHARFLVEDKKTHYIAVLKGNHPTLHSLVRHPALARGPEKNEPDHYHLDIGYSFTTAGADVGRIQESEVRSTAWYPLAVAERLVGHRIERAVSVPPRIS